MSWLSSPRNSLAPGFFFLVVGAALWILYGRRRKLVWPSLCFAGLAVACVAWRLGTLWIHKSLDVGFAERILLWSPDYGAREPRSIRIQGDEIRRAFGRVRVKPGRAEVRAYWWLRFEGHGRSVTYRVASTGEIGEDLPGCAFQDHYITFEPKWPSLLRMELHYMYDRRMGSED